MGEMPASRLDSGMRKVPASRAAFERQVAVGRHCADDIRSCLTAVDFDMAS